jgi:holo-[acyl-carrier protein] synthase
MGDRIAQLVEKHFPQMPASARVGTRRVRVGIDLTTVDEVAVSLARFGDRYAARVFTDREEAYCKAAGGRGMASRFAARFAAKEAAVKVLRPETPWTDWRSIEVRRHASGWCELVLHGEAASLAERQGLTSLALSMTHAEDYVVAVVVGQEEEGAPGYGEC